MSLKMDAPALNTFLGQVFEQVADGFLVEDVTEDGTLRVRLRVGDKHLRPGGTVSGPSIFSIADVGAYLITLSRIGPKALAVTTNCSIDFMRKPVANRDLIAEVHLLKLGKQLSVSDVMIRSDGDPAIVARATLTYALPPAKMG
ncbi:MAG: PaaI family thioesterase [Pseudomonadota bacterium]